MKKVVIELPKTTEYVLIQYTYFDENGVRQFGIDSFRIAQEDEHDA